jgi:hypothetical protein
MGSGLLEDESGEAVEADIVVCAKKKLVQLLPASGNIKNRKNKEQDEASKAH